MISDTTDRLIIKSKQEEIAKVETFIENVLQQYQLDTSNYGNVLISIIEGVNNAINHGNKGDETKDVTIDVCISDDKKNIVFKISDQGNGFDYSNLPNPTDPENIDKLGGRGVFLMKQLADLVLFEKGGSVIELVFKL